MSSLAQTYTLWGNNFYAQDYRRVGKEGDVEEKNQMEEETHEQDIKKSRSFSYSYMLPTCIHCIAETNRNSDMMLEFLGYFLWFLR